MPTFIDESGWASTDENRRYFHLVAVWVPTHDVANSLRTSLDGLAQDCGLGHEEFKFAGVRNHRDSGRNFVDLAANSGLQFATCSVDKHSPEWHGLDRKVLYWATLTHLAACMKPIYDRMEECVDKLREPVYLDNNGDGEYLKLAKQAFRGAHSAKSPGRSMTGDIAFRTSHTDRMLQVADVFCGLWGQYVLERGSYWYDRVSHRHLERNKRVVLGE